MLLYPELASLCWALLGKGVKVTNQVSLLCKQWGWGCARHVPFSLVSLSTMPHNLEIWSPLFAMNPHLLGCYLFWGNWQQFLFFNWCMGKCSSLTNSTVTRECFKHASLVSFFFFLKGKKQSSLACAECPVPLKPSCTLAIGSAIWLEKAANEIKGGRQHLKARKKKTGQVFCTTLVFVSCSEGNVAQK